MPGNTQTLLDVNQLSRHFGGIKAVDDISFEVQRGDILGFLGPNGAGKSTTMNMLCGVLAPSTGSIRINGADLFENTQEAKRFIGYLPEHPPLYQELTVDEYLIFCGRLHHIKKTSLTKTIKETKARCGLEGYGNKLIRHLSKGYQQRIGIAQAILHSPLLVILDEPTVGLDPNQILEIRQLIKDIGQEHGVILSTHILSEVQTVCNRVQIIQQGKLIFHSDLSTLKQPLEGNSIVVQLKHSPEKDKLLSISGIKDIEYLPENRIRIQYADNEPNHDKLLRACLEENWELTELMPELRSLEQIFVELTKEST